MNYELKIIWQKYKIKFLQKNKFNKRGDFLNEWGGFFNEGFFREK